MTMTKCKECGKEVSTTAKKCPHCGVDNPGVSGKNNLVGIAVLAVIIWAALSFLSSESKKAPSSYPTSNASYEELDSEVGCNSKYSDDKKKDIFNSRYKNHWMTWSGEVVLAEADEASLNIDGKGIQDLAVDFADKNAGYNLTKGNYIAVRFLMKHAGGCFLPFSGEQATVVR
jgi:hypothetical protein